MTHININCSLSQDSLKLMARTILINSPVENVVVKLTEPYIKHDDLEKKQRDEFDSNWYEQIGLQVTYFNIPLARDQTIFFPTIQKFQNQYERKLFSIEKEHVLLNRLITEHEATKNRLLNIPVIDIDADEIPF